MRLGAHRFPVFLSSACAIAGLCAVLAAQEPQQQPTFRSGASTVAVYATVTDSSGRLVPNLTREDFEVYDNGKLQPLTLFEAETQPITIAFVLTVVTPGMVADVAAAPLAVVAPTSRGAVVLTPE